MANEIFFLMQILLVLGFSLVAVRMGSAASTAWVALNGVLANLFIMKQVDLFGLTVTCSDVFAVGSIAGLNLMQERFGKEAAKQAIRVAFLAMFFFVLASKVHLWYEPSGLDRAHASFAAILAPAPRIVLASLAVFFIVQKLDVAFFGWLKGRFAKASFPLRMGISLFLSQLLDTILFSVAGLWGLVASLFDVMVMSFAVKCLIIACSAPLSALLRVIWAKGEEAG